MDITRFLVLLATVCVSASGMAIEGEYTISIKKKQEEKVKKRWTIADWLDTKKSMSAQDMWLAAHTKEIKYEFYVGGDQASFEQTITQAGTATTSDYKTTRGSMGFYNTIFGFEADYVDRTSHESGWDGSFNIRLFGNYLQNTNFTIQYGARNRNDTSSAQTEQFKNNFAGASLTLYIFKPLGITTHYQQILKKKGDQDTELTGTNLEATLFLDYGIMRLQGTWFNEELDLTNSSGSLTNRKSTGILAGLRFYL